MANAEEYVLDADIAQYFTGDDFIVDSPEKPIIKKWYKKKNEGDPSENIIYTKDTIHLYKGKVDFFAIKQKQMLEEYKQRVAALTPPSENVNLDFISGKCHRYFKVEEIFKMNPNEIQCLNIKVIGIHQIKNKIHYIKDYMNESAVEIDFSMNDYLPRPSSVVQIFAYLKVKRVKMKIVPLIYCKFWSYCSISKNFEDLLLLQRCIYTDALTKETTDPVLNEQITIAKFSDSDDSFCDDMTWDDTQWTKFCSEFSHLLLKSE